MLSYAFMHYMLVQCIKPEIIYRVSCHIEGKFTRGSYNSGYLSLITSSNGKKYLYNMPPTQCFNEWGPT